MSTINPRARALAQVSRAATQPARITQAARPTTTDPALNAWIGAMHEWRHVREGGGNPFEKVLTGRDLVAMGIATSTQITNPATRPAPAAPGVVISTPNGQAVLGWEQFTESIRNSRLIRDLGRRIDDPTRFDELHARTKAALLEELAPIDGKIRGEIRRVEEIATSAKESLAQEVTTIRASVARASAGVRSVRAASASENRATAGLVTTITARLDGFDGGASTVEEVMSAIADRTDGLEAKYTVKVTAGGAVAGFGLAATSNTAGASSAFIVQADKFAIVSSSYAGGLDTTPDVTKIPFGIDGTGIYMTGNVRIDGSLLVGTVTANNLNAATGTFSGSLSVNGTTGMSLVSGGSVGRIKLDASGNIKIVSSVAGKSIGFGGPNDGGVRVIDAATGTDNISYLNFYVPGRTSEVSTIYHRHPSPYAAGLGSLTVGTYNADKLTLWAGIPTFPATAPTGALRLEYASASVTAGSPTVTNLDADKLDGNHASAFATSAHNHSGVYLPLSGTAANSDALGGVAPAGYTRIVVGNVGTATASGGGVNLTMGTGLAPTYEVACSSNNIILQTASDERLKQDIEDEAHGMGFVRTLRPRRFRFISDPEYLQHGFIAQEMAAVATPNGEKDSLAFTREDGIMGINHLSLIAPLVKALQEVDVRLQALEGA